MVVKCNRCCWTSARGSYALAEHEFSAHSTLKRWSCAFPGCNHQTKTRQNLETHKRTHETRLELQKPFPCTIENCDYRAARKHKVENHILRKHTPGRTRDFQCPMCPSRYYSNSNLKDHVDRCHIKERRFACQQCKFKAHDRAYLRLHVKTVHEKSVKFNCSFPGCDFSTCHRTSFKLHGQKHDPKVEAVHCNFPECTYQASSLYQLRKHLKIRHNPNRAKAFPCPMCSRSFYTMGSVRTHISYFHTLEKAYTCDKCGYATQMYSTLKGHCRRVHKEDGGVQKRFKCDSCDYRARYKQCLTIHKIRVHTGEWKFKCHVLGCNLRTNYPEALKKHLLTHEKDPDKQFPFTCSFEGCDFRRRSRSEMASHERRHKSSKLKLKCQICPNRVYPDRNSLYFHKCTKHNHRSFKCSMCDYVVCQKVNLMKHIRTRHDPQFDWKSKPAEFGRGRTTIHDDDKETPVVLLTKIKLVVV